MVVVGGWAQTLLGFLALLPCPPPPRSSGPPLSGSGLASPEAEPLSSRDLPLTLLTSSWAKNVTLLHICLLRGWPGRGTAGARVRLTSLLSYMVI